MEVAIDQPQNSNQEFVRSAIKQYQDIERGFDEDIQSIKELTI